MAKEGAGLAIPRIGVRGRLWTLDTGIHAGMTMLAEAPCFP
jgi:hypothetical protein